LGATGSSFWRFNTGLVFVFFKSQRARDMRSVEMQKEDVPRDLDNPLFSLGFGLSFNRTSQSLQNQ